MLQQITRTAKDVSAYAAIGWKHGAFVRVDNETQVTLAFPPDVAELMLPELDAEDAKHANDAGENVGPPVVSGDTDT